MNILTAGAVKLDDASKWMKAIADGSADWGRAQAFLVGTLGIAPGALPDAINTYDKRMAAVKAVKEKIDALTQQQQRDMIDMQTLVNRRDVAYSTSSNVVRTLGASQEADAANF
jgi:rhamnogalacturonyl hydrolase YesR